MWTSILLLNRNALGRRYGPRFSTQFLCVNYGPRKVKAFCVLRSDAEKGRRGRGEQREGGGQAVTLQRARMAEQFGGGAAQTGHQQAGTDGHRAWRDRGKRRGLRRAQKGAQREVREERQGSESRAKRSAGRDIPGSDAQPRPEPRQSLPCGRRCLPGAKGGRGRGGAGEGGKSRSPVLVFCSRGPTPAESPGNGGSELRRAPRLPSLGKEREREFSPARCPAAACPGATRPRRARGERGRRSGTARLPQPPAAAPAPAPAPGLTVLVVLEVVVGAGPAAALGRVLHVVELQKVRPLAREAQEGGGQAPRQGHQPPGAGERRERAEEAAGRALASPIPPATGDQGARGPAVVPPGAVRRGTSGCGLCAGRAARPWSGSRPARRWRPGGRRARLPPVLPAPPGQVQRRPGGRGAQHHAGPCRGPSRRGEERNGEGRRAGAVPAPLLSRLPASSPCSFPGCRKDPRSGRAEETRSPCPTYPAGRRLSGRPSASRPRPLRTAGGTQRSCSPALPPAQSPGSGGLGRPGRHPLSARRDPGKARLGRRPRSCCYFLFHFDFFFPLCCLGPVLCFLQRSGCWSEGSTTFLQS